MQGRMSVFCSKNCKKCRLGVDNGPGLRYNNRRRREQHPGTPHGVCGRSSSGRAPPCQGGGSEFEPRRPLQTNSKEPVYAGFLLIMVTWPSGKARVCKTLIRQFKSARHLHKTVMKKMSQSFLLYRRKLAISPTSFQVAFCRDVQPFLGGWTFLLPHLPAKF